MNNTRYTYVPEKPKRKEILKNTSKFLASRAEKLVISLTCSGLFEMIGNFLG